MCSDEKSYSEPAFSQVDNLNPQELSLLISGSVY